MAKTLAWCTLILLCAGCATPKKTPPTVHGEKLAPNMAFIQAGYQQTWTTLIELLRYTYLLDFDIKDPNKGYFATTMTQTGSDVTQRAQISGTLTSNNQETLVKLYHHVEQKHSDGKWHALPSNKELEKQILHALIQKTAP